jgi:hypothetical protein
MSVVRKCDAVEASSLPFAPPQSNSQSDTFRKLPRETARDEENRIGHFRLTGGRADSSPC